MRVNPEIYDSLNAGEKMLVKWKLEFADGFTRRLFEAIAHADNSNRTRLSVGFPLEVRAFERFRYEEGWWVELERRLVLEESE